MFEAQFCSQEIEYNNVVDNNGKKRKQNNKKLKIKHFSSAAAYNNV